MGAELELSEVTTVAAVTPAYRYRAVLDRVIDADTFKLRVDLGFGVWSVITVRVRGIDTAELRTPDGDAAKAAVVRIFQDAPVIVIATYKDQMTFARWVADVWVDGELFADRLRREGWAKKP